MCVPYHLTLICFCWMWVLKWAGYCATVNIELLLYPSACTKRVNPYCSLLIFMFKSSQTLLIWWYIVKYHPILEAISFALTFSILALAAWVLGPMIPPPHRFLTSSYLSAKLVFTASSRVLNDPLSSLWVQYPIQTGDMVTALNGSLSDCSQS